MRGRTFQQRATELQITEKVTRRSRLWATATGLLATIGVGAWLAPVVMTESSVPSSVPSVSTTHEIEWYEVVQVLDSLRNRAVEERDLSALQRAVHPSGPAFAAESAVINSLIEQDIRVRKLDFRLVSVTQRFRRWTGAREYVDLEVVDQRSSYEEQDGSGALFTVAPREQQMWHLLLMRESPQAPWRIWSVSSAA